MSSYYYLTFHTSSYDTSKTYASRLQVMSKNSLVSIGGDLDMNIPMSWTKEKMVAHISSFVVAHPEQMVAMLDDEEIVLAHEIVEAGKQGVVVWKRHLLKYDHLKKMVWVLVNGDSKGKDGFVMVDEIRDAFAPYIELLLDVLRHLYCHLRHHQDISWQVKEAMDLHLMVTNKFHRLFGDLEIAWGDSRLEDMLSDDSPYCDYSDIEDELYDYLKKMVREDNNVDPNVIY